MLTSNPYSNLDFPHYQGFPHKGKAKMLSSSFTFEQVNNWCGSMIVSLKVSRIMMNHSEENRWKYYTRKGAA